jgi:hypothetical protein
MKTHLIIKGRFSRGHPTFQAQLYKIGKNCTIKVTSIVLNPRYPADQPGNYLVADRQFVISTSLISRPTFTDDGLIRTDETPLMIFFHLTSPDVPLEHENIYGEFFEITAPSTYCTFTISELPPYPEVDDEQMLKYWYVCNIHLVVEIPD